MKSTDQRTDRQRTKWHEISSRPIAVLGPRPIRTGHLTRICEEAVEIEFLERHDIENFSFSELAIIVPESNNPYLSGRVNVETIYCRINIVAGNGAESQIGNDTKSQNGSGKNSKMRKCVVSLDNMEPNQKKLLKNACA